MTIQNLSPSSVPFSIKAAQQFLALASSFEPTKQPSALIQELADKIKGQNWTPQNTQVLFHRGIAKIELQISQEGDLLKYVKKEGDQEVIFEAPSSLLPTNPNPIWARYDWTVLSPVPEKPVILPKMDRETAHTVLVAGAAGLVGLIPLAASFALLLGANDWTQGKVPVTEKTILAGGILLALGKWMVCSHPIATALIAAPLIASEPGQQKIRDAKEALLETGRSLYETLCEKGASVGNAVRDCFYQKTQAVEDTLESAEYALFNQVDSAIDAVENSIDYAGNAVADKIESTLDAVGTSIESAGDALFNSAERAFDQFEMRIDHAGDVLSKQVKQAFREIEQRVFA